MSDNIGKCPEMIGYVGDVRMLAYPGYAEVKEKEIIKWVNHSKNETFVTLFYSSKDVWHVGSKKDRLLQINPNLKIKQVSDIQTFIDYVYNGMDRSEHPVKEIAMINVQSTWSKGSIDGYIEEQRKKEVVKTIHSILLDNESVKAYAKKHQISNEEALNKLEKKYHYDESKAIGDEIINTAGNIKENVDFSKERINKVFSKGLDGYEAKESIKVTLKPEGTIKGGVFIKGNVKDTIKGNFNAKNVNKMIKVGGNAVGVYGDIMAVKTLGDETEKFNKSRKQSKKEYEECMKDADDPQSKNFANQDRCFTINYEKSIINLSTFISESSGHPEFKDSFMKAGRIK